MTDVPVQMHINAPRLAHHFFDSQQPLIQPVQIVLFLPYIAIHHLFADGAAISFYCGLAAVSQKNLLGVIRAAGERRVYIHQVNRDVFGLQVRTGGHAIAPDKQIPEIRVRVNVLVKDLLPFGSRSSNFLDGFRFQDLHLVGESSPLKAKQRLPSSGGYVVPLWSFHVLSSSRQRGNSAFAD